MTKKDLMGIKSFSELRKYLISLGYEEISGGGSHRVFKAKNRPTLSIPCHNGSKGDVAPGTRRNVVKLLLGEGV